jgi:hypothetical protein
MRVSLARGERVAAAVAGSWREPAEPLRLSAPDLAEITPLLLRSGAAGLVSRRLGPDAASCRAAFELRQAYRLHTLQAALHERAIVRAMTALRAAGVEPLLAKGWAAARLYPQPGLRPYGDIDLCVRPEDFRTAQAALSSAAAEGDVVDLHNGFAMLDDVGLQRLFDRSVLVGLNGIAVRTLGPEDHLRYLCLHMLGHGAWRPLWLCDLGAALESLSASLDWDRVFVGSRRRSEWVSCALALAHELLGARLQDAPAVIRNRRLPAWLVPSVLRAWGQIQTAHGNRTPMAVYLRRPQGLLAALRQRWPGAVEASIGVGASPDDLPRLPFQLAECVSRTLRFALRLAMTG